MRLKKIRLAGFKSFVDGTNIPFPGDMTAIVGPNGCGKSNVIDAVRWVLGESSAKNLRGDAMTDVIFNGSSARKPVSQCSVELVFDNSSGRIAGEYAKYNELSVKRVVTKDAISSYLLNGTKCRRRDITDLFLGTGLGPRSYAIIEQGMISRLIESKPQELRVFIEEAAGISKYKERRRETLNRIQHTKDNLDRLQDVRSELADQLAKLKRQATAATRYKELRQQERTLKGQVATLRWLAQTELVKQSDKIIQQRREELNGLMASKQGDESGLQSLKNDVAIQKQTFNDLQTSIYTLGNEITKLEQSQIFSKKRLGQIQHEKQQLHQQQESLEVELVSITEELAELSEQIELVEPEKFILEEKLEDIQVSKLTLEEQAAAIERKYKQDDNDYFQRKQQLQSLHGKLQQSLSSQQRSEDRLAEINQELVELGNEDESELSALTTRKQQANEHLNDAKSQLIAKQDAVKKCRQRLHQYQEEFNEARRQKITQQAQLEALSALQGNESQQAVIPDWMDETKLVAIWQAFSVPQNYASRLETVLQQFDKIKVYADELPDKSQLNKACSVNVLFAHSFTQEKLPNTLASVVEQERVPSFFNLITLVDNANDIPVIPEIDRFHSYLLPNGHWIGNCVLITPNARQESKVERANKMRQIQSQLYDLEIAISESQEFTEQTKTVLTGLEQDEMQLEQHAEAANNAFLTISNQLQLSQMRQEQNLQREQKLRGEIARQNEILNDEEENLALINEQIEEMSIDVAEKEDVRHSRESEREQVGQQLQDIVAQFNQAQSQMHQQQLKVQQIRNSLQLTEEQSRTKTQIKDANIEKIAMLDEEAETLLMPSDDQAQRLNNMLERKHSLSEEQATVNKAIESLEDEIKTLEKGQSGINAKIETVKEAIESERLHGESARVRAQSFIEQLGEMKMPVREILDDLPDDAQEHLYQQELEKVSAAIQRLGAVNLAAVDEYSEQAERKQHLDDQNDDLTGALETLEDAMRKIDRETRTRFKATFDKVNEDLKMLFPKVFGGGSAYLAMTDDDLLETGVTIMARPPGKKNSTIALLSGGEKALTALSLVFAIFRLNPAPFCLLDEVDAPLDDANVGRFCNLVSEMSKTVQFIYITHNKVAMEMATHLTGVTMSEPGVSRMVSVNMDEALAIAE